MQKKRNILPYTDNCQKEEPLSVGQKLDYLKRRDQLTVKELSRRSGVPAGTLNKLLCGVTHHPSMQTVERLAETFQVPLLYFSDDFEKARPACESAAAARRSSLTSLTLQELRLLRLYRRGAPREKKIIEGFLESLDHFYRTPPCGDDALTLPCYVPAHLGAHGVAADGMTVHTIQVRADKTAQQADFAALLYGVSMEPAYTRGAILAVQRAQAHHDQAGIFVLNGEGYIRLYFDHRGVRRLDALNRAVPNIPVRPGDDLRCLGTVIGALTRVRPAESGCL